MKYPAGVMKLPLRARARARAVTSFGALTFAAIAMAEEALALTGHALPGPGWTHFWCPGIHAHAAGAHIHTHLLAAFAPAAAAAKSAVPPWPHNLPIPAGLGTFWYLRRAGAHHRATTRRQAAAGGRSMPVVRYERRSRAHQVVATQ
jgi:hypothetical protein